MSKARARRDLLADPAVAENADRSAGELGPQRRQRRADRPVALPIALSQRCVEPRKLARQGQHRPHDILGNSDLMAVGVGEQRARRKRCTIDPVDPGSGNLDELEPRRRPSHLSCQPHRHQHVDLGQPRKDVGFGCDDDVAWDRQVAAHRLFEAGGKRADKSDVKHLNYSRGG